MKKNIMKKIPFATIFMLILLLIPIICNADVGLPGITSYKVRVKNPNGITIKTYNDGIEKHFPYDSILEIRWEINQNNKLCGLACEENGSEEYLVDLSEVELMVDRVDTSGLTPNKEVKTKYVYDEGAYLYKGPSKLYGKLDENIMIPVGTTISYEYSDEVWAYVEYNGYKGWVYIYSMIDVSQYREGSCLVDLIPNYWNTSLYTLKDIHLTASPRSTKENGVIIPAFTEITYKYYYFAHAHKHSFCLEYNGKEGWYEVEDFALAYNCKDIDINLIAVADIPVYSSFRNIDSTVITTIPKNTECEVIYVYSDEYDTEKWCYVVYNGKEGWILNTREDTKFCLNKYSYEYNYNNTEQDQLLVDAEIFDEIDGKTTGITIPKGSILFKEYHYSKHDNNTQSIEEWYYVYDDTYKGWVKCKYSDWKHIKSQEIKDEKDNTNEIKNENLNVEENNEDKLSNINQSTNEVELVTSFKIIIIECIVLAVIIAVIAIVAIKFVNKKKKDN